MIPIFFPYTYISDPVAEAVAACFGHFMVYQPLADRLPLTMQAWVDQGVITIRIPVREYETELASAAENYMQWADLTIGNTGLHPGSLKTLKASAPLTDPSLSSHIVAEVKEQAGSAISDQPPDPVLKSRIFLYFAQTFDQQSAELDDVLEKFEKKKQGLIQDLKAEADTLANEFKKDSNNIPDANTDYLIPERLEAWSRLFLKDRTPPDLFVTHRLAVVEQLLDAAPRSEKILNVEGIPRSHQTSRAPTAWQDEFLAYLYEIINKKWHKTFIEKLPKLEFPFSDNAIALEIYLVPNQNALQLFSRASGMKDPGTDLIASPRAGAMNTLVCLVQP
jgi:hypothetical protein